MIPVARNEVGAYAISAAHVSMIHCVPHSRTYIRAPGIDESECYIRMGCSWGLPSRVCISAALSHGMDTETPMAVRSWLMKYPLYMRECEGVLIILNLLVGHLTFYLVLAYNSNNNFAAVLTCPTFWSR